MSPRRPSGRRRCASRGRSTRRLSSTVSRRNFEAGRIEPHGVHHAMAPPAPGGWTSRTCPAAAATRLKLRPLGWSALPDLPDPGRARRGPAGAFGPFLDDRGRRVGPPELEGQLERRTGLRGPGRPPGRQYVVEAGHRASGHGIGQRSGACRHRWPWLADDGPARCPGVCLQRARILRKQSPRARTAEPDDVDVPATAGDAEVGLAWLVRYAETATAMQVRWKALAELPYDDAVDTWTDLPASAAAYTAAGLENGTEYTFAVRVVTASGPGPTWYSSATPGSSPPPPEPPPPPPPPEPPPPPPPPPTVGSCRVADAETLCLQDSRFEVKMDWLSADGESGRLRRRRAGRARRRTDDSGLFRFFDPLNWEILIKVLDGCGINARRWRIWVLGAATTDLGYRTGEGTALLDYACGLGSPTRSPASRGRT